MYRNYGEINILSQPDYKLYDWKLDMNELKNWNHLHSQCPRSLAMDCAVNVASFLKLINRDYAEAVAQRKNFFKQGSSIDELQEVVYRNVHSENSPWIKKTIIGVPLRLDGDTYNLIREKLKKGYLTSANFYTETNNIGRGHSVIIGIMPNNKMAIIDPQQKKIYYEDEDDFKTFINDWYTVILFFKNREKRIRDEGHGIRRESSANSRSKKRLKETLFETSPIHEIPLRTNLTKAEKIFLRDRRYTKKKLEKEKKSKLLKKTKINQSNEISNRMTFGGYTYSKSKSQTRRTQKNKK